MPHMSDKAKQALDKIIQKFQNGNLGPIVDVARARFEGGDKPCHHWTLNNQYLAYLGTGSLDCRGFNQWKEVGRYPTCKATAWIMYPRHRFVEDDDGEKTKVFSGFGYASVWGYNQTDGEPLYDEEELTPNAPPPLSEVAEAMGIKVEYIPLPPDRLGDARRDGSHVRLGTQEISVWFHEFGHAVHARVVDGLDHAFYGDNEVVAELTAATLMDAYGYRDHSGNAWEYIKCYADDPLTAVKRAASDVGEVISYIYERTES